MTTSLLKVRWLFGCERVKITPKVKRRPRLCSRSNRSNGAQTEPAVEWAGQVVRRQCHAAGLPQFHAHHRRPRRPSAQVDRVRGVLSSGARRASRARKAGACIEPWARAAHSVACPRRRIASRLRCAGSTPNPPSAPHRSAQTAHRDGGRSEREDQLSNGPREEGTGRAYHPKPASATSTRTPSGPNHKLM